MFSLGYTYIGSYRLWVTTPVFTVDPLDDKAQDLSYFLIHLTKKDYWGDMRVWYSQNLIDSPLFNFMFALDKRKNPTAQTDLVEFEHYKNIKFAQGNTDFMLYKLSRSHVEELIERCRQLEKTNLLNCLGYFYKLNKVTS